MHSKGNYKQGEKITLRMGKNNSKWNNWQRIKFQKHTSSSYKSIPGKETKQSKSGEKTVSSISGAGKTGQLNVNEWN